MSEELLLWLHWLLLLVSALEPCRADGKFSPCLAPTFSNIQASVATPVLHENTSEYCSYSYIVLRRRHTENTLYYIKFSNNFHRWMVFLQLHFVQKKTMKFFLMCPLNLFSPFRERSEDCQHQWPETGGQWYKIPFCWQFRWNDENNRRAKNSWCYAGGVSEWSIWAWGGKKHIQKLCQGIAHTHFTIVWKSVLEAQWSFVMLLFIS